MEAINYSLGEHAATAELSENSALLRKRPSGISVWARRYGRSHMCVSSKAALFVLLWTFIVVTTYGIVNNRAGYMVFISLYSDLLGFDSLDKALVITALYAMSAALLCFYPLAGYLADNKFGRYKTVIRSLYVLLVVLVILNLVGAILMPLYITSLKPNWDDRKTILTLVLTLVAIGVFILLACTVSSVGFSSNVIQFGMDQLHDSPGDHQSLFIHWYMWVYYLGIFIIQLEMSMVYYLNLNDFLYYCLVVLWVLLNLMYLVVLLVSLCVAHYKRRWFIVDPARPNPYKLVYRVTKFARHHKVPVHRSAFTYCEDEVPSGLDLGKDKYGGPFTTEQVEDVKAFYGILKVLFALSPVFFFDIATDPLLYFYAVHGSQYNVALNQTGVNHNHEFIELYLLQNGLLSPILKVVCIPLYLCLLRPFISGYIPGMLRRMGIGIGLVVMSLICTFLMDTAAHAQEKNADICMFSYNSFDKINSTAAATWYASFQDTSALVIQRCLGALSDMLIYIALYEFVCSQSPHSMKGLLIGLSFAIRGFFEGIAAVIMIPFFFIQTSFPSCGMEYYLMNIPLSVVTLLLYVWVARRYKFRERDEPCNVRRYVEDYYSNLKQERQYTRIQ